jgi:hypothetical protein
VYVEDFMVTDVKYIYHGMPFEDLKNLLKDNKKIQSFPLVNNPVRLILLGSIPRMELIELLERQVGRERRLQELTEEEEKECRKDKSSQFQVGDTPTYSESDSDDMVTLSFCFFFLLCHHSNNLLFSQFTYNPAYESPPKSKSVKLVRF